MAVGFSLHRVEMVGFCVEFPLDNSSIEIEPEIDKGEQEEQALLPLSQMDALVVYQNPILPAPSMDKYERPNSDP